MRKISELLKIDFEALPVQSIWRMIRNPASFAGSLVRACVAQDTDSTKCSNEDLVATYNDISQRLRAQGKGCRT